MFTVKKRFLKRGLRAVALMGLALCLVDCGGAASSAPPVSIPAPVVTKIRIDTPDNGISTITGEAGAVTGGNIVRAVNLTQEGLAYWWEPLFWGTAYAQTTNETTSNADGSFTLDIEAAIGDQIQLFQIENGVNGTPIVLTVPFVPMPLNFAPVAMALDATTSQTWMTGQFLGNGIINPIIFGNPPSTGAGISLPVECNDPNALAIDSANARAIVVSNTGDVCSQPLDGSTGASLGPLTVNPVNIAIHAAAAKAVITNNTAAANVEISILDLTIPAFAPAPIANPIGSNPNQVSTPVVATGSDAGNDYAVVVIEYANGEFYGFVIDVNFAFPIGTGSLLGINGASDLAIFNNRSAVLVDDSGVAHILDIDVLTGAVTITNTVDVGTSPDSVTIDNNSRAFVTNNGDNTISVLGLTPGSETVITTLDAGVGPTSIDYDFTNDQLGLIHNGEQTAIVFGNLP